MTEDLSRYLLSEKERRELTFWKMRCEKQLEDWEFEAMMIRKYATHSFYKRCRNMTMEQLNERLWKINNSHIPWNKIQLEEAARKLYLDYMAREQYQDGMRPFKIIDLSQHQLIQPELF